MWVNRTKRVSVSEKKISGKKVQGVGEKNRRVSEAEPNTQCEEAFMIDRLGSFSYIYYRFFLYSARDFVMNRQGSKFFFGINCWNMERKTTTVVGLRTQWFCIPVSTDHWDGWVVPFSFTSQWNFGHQTWPQNKLNFQLKHLYG